MLLPVALFAAQCFWNPALPFVVQDGDAPWIAYPEPATGLMGLAPRDALPVTRFARALDAGADPARATLRIRALRRFVVHVNGEPVGPPAAGKPAHWRTFTEIDLSPHLRRGRNRIRVDVTNPTGPPLLSLRLAGGFGTLRSDPSWTASPEGKPPRPAVRVDAEQANPTSYAMPSPAEGLGRRSDVVAAAVALGALLFVVFRRGPWPARALRAAPWLAAALWLGPLACNAVRIPAAVGFDAHHHVAYVEFLREHQRLPLATDGWSMFHPPAYYLPTAALVSLTRGSRSETLRGLGWKAIGLLSGLAGALLAAALARRVTGASREAGFAAALAAVLPMNVYVSSYVTNESLAAAAISGVLLCTVWLLQRPDPTTRNLLVWSGVASLALLGKYTAWIAVGVAGSFLLHAWLRIGSQPPGRAVRRVAVVAAAVAAVAGWFYLRNLLHFGQPFPLNVDLPGATQVWWSQPGYATPAFFTRFGGVLAHPFLAGFHSAWDSFYATLWGDGQLAGQMAAGLRHRFWDWDLMAVGYWAALPATLLIAAGTALSLRTALGAPDARVRVVHGFLLAFSWLLLLSVLYMTLRQPDYGQAKAFYALSGMAPLALYFGIGAGAADRWLETRALHAPRALFQGWLFGTCAILVLPYFGP